MRSNCEQSVFENHYSVFILNTCSRKSLEVNEHKFIHALKTLQPHGLNAADPFGLPIWGIQKGPPQNFGNF